MGSIFYLSMYDALPCHRILGPFFVFEFILLPDFYLVWIRLQIFSENRFKFSSSILDFLQEFKKNFMTLTFVLHFKLIYNILNNKIDLPEMFSCWTATIGDEFSASSSSSSFLLPLPVVSALAILLPVTVT